MALPESSDWTDFDPKEIGDHFGSLLESVIAEFRDEKDAAIDRLERENELLRARIDELAPAIGREAA